MTSGKALNLFFPQWQGSNNIGLYRGAHLLRDALSTKDFASIPVSHTYSLTTHKNILGYSQITAQLSAAHQLIESRQPNKIFTLGGDCGVEIAPVSFLNQKYGSSLAIIWLDAHGDLNTPDSSPSAHFHGMPLRTLLGGGDPTLVGQAFSVLDPEQIFLVGTRELDPPEGRFIQQHSLTVLSSKAVNEENTESLLNTLKAAGFTKLYIHLDLDVIDPEDFPHVACLTPNGISLENLKALLLYLRNDFEIVGGSILEFLPAPATIHTSKAVQIVKSIRALTLEL